MQTQYPIILATCALIGLLLMTCFTRRTIWRILARIAAARSAEVAQRRESIAGLNLQLAKSIQYRKAVKARRQKENQAQKEDQLSPLTISLDPRAPIFTKADHQLLMQVHVMLLLAKQTWHAMQGTEPIQLKAEIQAQKILALADRILTALTEKLPPEIATDVQEIAQ
ncbi:hypothetical protein [Pseudomonas fluorescens]|uniref:Uncharacterized protein n=1 Tax=Pseudomonas fluorescens TaxID=294 RepID=A0AAE2U138_PSEFL|nr:hypothetical protein [Pseudomonas fluorescens]MBD8268837.1 hypothetical protein [Pseudomonas fluorescens]